MSVAAVITLVGGSMIGCAILGFIFAMRRNRSADTWATFCFFFPPALILLLMMPRLPMPDPGRAIGRGLSDLSDD
ncbi:MAG: hypothetical protein GC150_02040 [Rhizobiales bacterium]|nr:hypothetical protein [Hyphomicrobiales bacterium]